MSAIGPRPLGPKPTFTDRPPDESLPGKPGATTGQPGAVEKGAAGALPEAGDILGADTLERIAPNRISQLISAPRTHPSGPAGLSHGDPPVSPDAERVVSAFIAANAANPEVLRSVANAASRVAADPDAFVGADGSVSEQALSGLVRSELAATGEMGSATYANLASVADADIAAMAFIVVMEAAKSAREDLAAIMEGVKSVNKEKQGWRGGDGGSGETAEVARGASPTASHAAGAKETANSDLDSLSEMGEMESFRLQQHQDRLAKVMEMMSNLIKKTSETSSIIAQNLK